MMSSSISSFASTVSATLTARPCTRWPSVRAASKPMWRGLGGKNTKPTRLAPESSATSSACGVLRPQILIDRGIMRRVLPPYPLRRKVERADYGSGGGMTVYGAGSGVRGVSGVKRRRITSSSWCSARTSASSLRAARRHRAWPTQATVPPTSTPRMTSTTMRTKSGNVTA